MPLPASKPQLATLPLTPSEKAAAMGQFSNLMGQLAAN